MTDSPEVRIRPATNAEWPDVEFLLDRRGGVNGCWCMFFRLPGKQLRAGWGEGNRRALCSLVDRGGRPGLVAYRGGHPVGWVSIAPREQYPRLDRSPVAKRVDDAPVWALTCLYVPKEARGSGVARELVRGALDYAGEHAARWVEAYPVDDALGPVPADSAYHGLVGLLREFGFTEVARRTPKRPVMRHDLG